MATSRAKSSTRKLVTTSRAPTRTGPPRVIRWLAALFRLVVKLIVRRVVLGFGLLALGIVSLSGVFAPPNSWGAAWWRFLVQALGYGAIIGGLLITALGIVVLRPSRLEALMPHKKQLTAFGVLLVSLLGLAGVASNVAGGVLGWLVAWPLIEILGSTVAGVIFGGFAFASLFVMLESNGAELLSPFKALPEAIGERFRRERLEPIDVAPIEIGLPATTDEDIETEEPVIIAPRRPIPARPARAPEPTPALVPSGELPPIDLLEQAVEVEPNEKEVRRKAQLLEETLAHFGVPARVVEWNQGPTFTQFGVEPGFDVKYREVKDRDGNVRTEEVSRTKVKVARITSLANDLALALSATTIRIEAPVPGKSVVGIEVPNVSSAVVSLRGQIESAPFQKLRTKARLGLALGKDVEGRAVVADLAKMPHLLIAGSTGSGKSVAINAIIACLLMHCTPDDVRLLMVDPKRVEMIGYDGIPHLLAPVVVDLERVVGVLKLVVQEMQNRYQRFAEVGVRNIDGYNRKVPEDQPRLPYWVIIIDELADLMMVAPDDVERLICRLAQMARATGIHLVIATQRPSVDVVTGLIKANFPTRIAFAVTSQVDSRTILDTPGAEKLLGRGDMLFLPPDAAKPHRLQGVYVSDDEIAQVVEYWKSVRPTQYVEAFLQIEGNEEAEDPLIEEAKRVLGDREYISVSELQRRLRIGYNRAARIKEMLEEHGLIESIEGKWE